MSYAREGKSIAPETLQLRQRRRHDNDIFHSTQNPGNAGLSTGEVARLLIT